jgi:hypothetical protein
MRVIAVLVGATALQHGVQAILGAGKDPQALIAEHIVVCAIGLVAAFALWRGERWAPWVLTLNGVAVATLVVSLGPLLAMDPAARNGLWVGAATIALLTAAAAWYTYRRVTPLSF